MCRALGSGCASEAAVRESFLCGPGWKDNLDGGAPEHARQIRGGKNGVGRPARLDPERILLDLRSGRRARHSPGVYQIAHIFDMRLDSTEARRWMDRGR